MLTKHENMLANINREVDRLGIKHEVIAIATEIPLAKLQRKLSGASDFTIGEIVNLARALKFNPSTIFRPQQPQVEMKPCPDQANTADNFATIQISTRHARIFIEENREYWGGDPTVPIAVRLTDDSESHLLLSPAEALSVAAALHSVAVYLMGQQSREIRRHTEPGAPTFEEGI